EEAHDVSAGGAQAGEAGGAETAPWFPHDRRPQLGGDRGGGICRAVFDDDGPVARWETRQDEGQRGGLVHRRQEDVEHGVTPRRLGRTVQQCCACGRTRSSVAPRVSTPRAGARGLRSPWWVSAS